jgi:uncharacterized protein YdhG (YjbR/CyaY superfamily)
VVPKFANLDEFYLSLPADQEQATKRFVNHIVENFPKLDLVLAWNQPMFKFETRYIVGFMPTKKHINLLTLTDDAISALSTVLAGYKHGSRSIALPLDWSIDADLIKRIVDFQLAQP